MPNLQFTDIDFQNACKILNAILNPRVSDPSSPTPWAPWFNTTDRTFKYFDGTHTHTLLSSLTDDRAYMVWIIENGQQVTVPDRHQLVIGGRMVIQNSSRLVLQDRARLVVR